MDRTTRMKEMDRVILGCRLCRLHAWRTSAVPGHGRIEDVEAVIIGEAPGRNEDLEGKPFVGSGGKLLDELLKKAGLDRKEVYITNVVKCRPPENRKPEKDEVEICTKNYLDKQLEVLKPLLIVTLGATALEYFTGKKKMGEFHGKLTNTKYGIPLLPTYHPAVRDFVAQDQIAIEGSRSLTYSVASDLSRPSADKDSAI
ncbi:MAG: uracil-DNA glycosylase, partial [Nitrososphaerota archaeon]|nr:uracil-DNA glycosylase [Nitrososphaerota archaeon]